MPVRSRVFCFASREAGGNPDRLIVPVLGVRIPASIFSKVLFPDPFEPTRPTTPLEATSKLMSLIAGEELPA